MFTLQNWLVSLGCVTGFWALLFGYIKICKNKYYDKKDPSSLSNTFYKTGGWFRAVLIALILLLVFPVLQYVQGGAEGVSTWLAYGSKISMWAAMAGLFGVSLFADFNNQKEGATHIAMAGGGAALGAFLGTMLQPLWWASLGVWLLSAGYWMGYRYPKQKDASAWYAEAVAFSSIAICLILIPILSYLIG